MSYKDDVTLKLLNVAGYFAARHIRDKYRGDKVARPSILSGPASRFIVKYFDKVDPIFAASLLDQAYHGARFNHEKSEIARLWRGALLAADSPQHGILYAYEALKQPNEPYSNHSEARYVVAQLSRQFPDTPRASQEVEPYLRFAAMTETEDDSLGIVSQWESRIQTIRQFDPEDANQRAARAYFDAPGGSLLSRVADQNTSLDLLVAYGSATWAETFVPKRPRTTGIVQLGGS